jgi:hypothetical protein
MVPQMTLWIMNLEQLTKLGDLNCFAGTWRFETDGVLRATLTPYMYQDGPGWLVETTEANELIVWPNAPAVGATMICKDFIGALAAIVEEPSASLLIRPGSAQ